MSTIDVTCPACGANVKAPERLAGRTGKCPKCHESMAIPDAPAAVADDDYDYDAGADTDADADADAERDDAELDAVADAPRARPQPAPANPTAALLKAAGAAALGAVVWAGIAYATNHEIGWLAWGIGLAVGAAAVSGGGRGPAIASACAGLALLSIFAGKMVGTQLLLGRELDTLADTAFTQERYEELRFDATEFAKLPVPPEQDAVRTFMVEHDFTDAVRPENVEDAEVDEFLAGYAPFLRDTASNMPSLVEWQRQGIAEVRASVSILDAVFEDLDGIDLLFAVLGISTAFGVVMRASHRVQLQERMQARAARRGGSRSGSSTRSRR